MSQNIPDESQIPTEQPTGAALLGKMSDAISALQEAQEHLVNVAKDVAKHTTDPNAHGAATLANIAKALPTPVLEDGMFTFKDAAGNPLMEPVNIKGAPGVQGEKGEDGDKGDMPDHRWDGTALQIQKPDGSWGEPQDLQGPKGLDGADGAPGLAPAHEWDGTSLKFKNPDGTWGEAQNLQGPKGEDGTDGSDGAPGQMPDHQWNGTSLQIQNPDGSWGEPQDLKGEKGDPGVVAIATAEQPGVVRPDGATTMVGEEGLLSALGGNLQFNDALWLTESGSFVPEVTGWYQVLVIGGGDGGNAQSEGAASGRSGGYWEEDVYLVAGEEVPVIIGAGGIGNDRVWPNPAPENQFGGITTFGNISSDDSTKLVNELLGLNLAPGSRANRFDGPNFHRGTHTDLFARALGGGPGGGHYGTSTPQCSATFFGGGGGAMTVPQAAAVDGVVTFYGNGAQGAVRLFFHNPVKASGEATAAVLFSMRSMARGAPRPVTVNLYDPETGQGSVWREEDAEAKMAEGLIGEDAWLEICAAKVAEEYAAWLADPDTEAERFAHLRAAREARLAATDYLVAPDYPLTDEDRAAVIAYRQALRDLPAQEGAPWDGGGELTPWPEAPAVSKEQVEPDEVEQTEEPGV